MSEEEENNAQQPKRPKLFGLPTTPDAHLWKQKISTWLAAAAASSSAGLFAYAQMPARVQVLMPDWLLLTLGGIAIVSALLIPIATSLQQKART